MASVNKVILLGNLGADPEVRYTQSGKAVANLRMATNEVWNDRDGNRQERTEWHSITVWGKTAEVCGQYLAKGRQVYVEGRLQSREYEKDGVNRKVWDVIADQVVFLSGGEGDRRGSQGGGGRSNQSWGSNNQGGGNGGGWGRGGGQGRSQGGGQNGGGWGNQGGQGGQQGRPQNHSQGGGDFEDDPIPF